jgi:hypothetical protein
MSRSASILGGKTARGQRGLNEARSMSRIQKRRVVHLSSHVAATHSKFIRRRGEQIGSSRSAAKARSASGDGVGPKL